MAAMGTRRDRKPYYDEEPVIAGAMKYHREFCPSVAMIGPSQRRLKSWKEALHLGLEPCRKCRPFHPDELREAPQRSGRSSTVPVPSLPAQDIADVEAESDEAAELAAAPEWLPLIEKLAKALAEARRPRSNQSVPAAFEEVVKTLKEIAVRLELPLESRIKPDELINTLAGQAKANFPAWLASMMHFMRQVRNRVVHPSEGDPVTDNQLEAWRACFEVFQEWAERWGWKR
jgi:hypothetical protein